MWKYKNTSIKMQIQKKFRTSANTNKKTQVQMQILTQIHGRNIKTRKVIKANMNTNTNAKRKGHGITLLVVGAACFLLSFSEY